MKKIAAILFVILGLNTALSQEKNTLVEDNPKRFKYYFNGGFGFYFPQKSTNALSKKGPVYTFQFQCNYKDNYFTRVFFDQSNINYQDEFTLNGLNIRMNDYIQTNAFGLDVGYSLFEKKKLSYFGYIGAGAATMRTPLIRYSPTDDTLETYKSTKTFLNLRTGVGIEYEFNKFFIIYLEAQYSSIPFETDLSKKQLNGISTILGFKTPLQ